MMNPIQNRFRHRFPNQTGTWSGTTDQTQTQTQTVVECFSGLSVASKSIQRFGSRGLALEKRMAAVAALSRGVR